MNSTQDFAESGNNLVIWRNRHRKSASIISRNEEYENNWENDVEIDTVIPRVELILFPSPRESSDD